MSKYRKILYLIVLFTFSFFSVFWMLSIDNSFSYDDVTWMLKVSTNSYEDLFNFFPHSVYNDRPIGAIFLKWLYSAFGLDYGKHHVVLVIVHLLNVLLTFLVAENIFGRKYIGDIKYGGGVITAAFFGIWSRTHMAVQWDAAIFDLLGTFWSLLSILFYLRYRNKKMYKEQNIFLMILFYFFAIRTKEMFLILPILFIIYEIWEMFLDKVKSLTLGTKLSIIVGIVFLSILCYYKVSGKDTLTNDMNNPYYQSFNPIKLIYSLLRYSMHCFDLENGGWVYTFSISGLIGTILLILGLIVAVVKVIRDKKAELILCYMAIGVSIVMVLPMVNQVHVLYLYFPSIFVGLLIACVASRFKRYDLSILILMCFFLGTGSMKGNNQTKSIWIENARLEKRAWDDIKDIQAPMSGATIYIDNIDNKDYTPFFYGEGAVCKLLYNDTSLNVKLLGENEMNEVEYVRPYVVWEYKNGRVREIERSSFLINAVYKYFQKDGTLILGIVPDIISNSMMVYVDGIEVLPTIGETFVSVQLPKELVKGKETITLNIRDAHGTVSEDFVLNLED